MSPLTRWSEYSWEFYTVLDGLAGMRVEDLLQDDEGFIWVATADGGVSRFDGRHFDNLTESDGLPYPTVMAIAQCRPGELVFGTMGAGVAFWRDGTFRTLGVQEGLPSDDVLGMRTLGEDRLAVATTAGLAIISEGRLCSSMTTLGGKPMGRIYDILEDSTGRLWFATLDHGVVDADGTPMPAHGPEGPVAIRCPWQMAPDRDGCIWIATQYAGRQVLVYRYDPTLEVAEAILAPEPPAGTQSVKQGVRHVRLDRRGRVWLAYRGVWVHEHGSWRRVGSAVNLSDTRLTYEDLEGNLWVGLWGGGLASLDPAGLERWGTEDGLPDQEVTSLARDAQGRIWAGTMTGVATVDPQTREVTVPDEGSGVVLAVSADMTGRIWTGGEHGRLLRRDTTGYTAFPVGAGEDDLVECLWGDADGRMWWGTFCGRFGWVQGDEKHVVATDLQNVRCFTDGPKGTLYLGSFARHPVLYHFDHIAVTPILEGELERIHYVDALLENAGAVWLGTGNGLYRYEPETGSLCRFTQADGLSANAILALARDHADRLWIGTSGGGVVRYDGRDFQILPLGRGVGANIVEAILPEPDGAVWLGTRGGLYRYTPGTTPPRVYIRSVVAGSTYHRPTRLSCSESVPELRIAYQAIAFRTAAKGIRYRYRIGTEQEVPSWSALTPDTKVCFQRLPPGEYRFEVLAIDFDGLESPIASVVVTILADERHQQVQSLQQALSPGSEPLIGTCAAVRQVKVEVTRVATSDVPVLICGETGTGKGLIARLIHHDSARRDGPFIHVNCGSLPEALIGSELFGHERGAFTGAVKQHVGLIELATGGTLFLDEIGDLPKGAQATLLHLLDRTTVRRVGGGTPLFLDARIIAATNRDLEAGVASGEFRADLLYRLDGYRILVPPLRERLADLPDLAEHFLRQQAQHLLRPQPRISREALDALQAYDWPGNVRELEHVLRRGLLRCRGSELNLIDLESGFGKAQSARLDAPPVTPASRYAALTNEEKEIIATALAATRGVVSGPHGAAALLGIHPEKLRSRMRKHGL